LLEITKMNIERDNCRVKLVEMKIEKKIIGGKKQRQSSYLQANYNKYYSMEEKSGNLIFQLRLLFSAFSISMHIFRAPLYLFLVRISLNHRYVYAKLSNLLASNVCIHCSKSFGVWIYLSFVHHIQKLFRMSPLLAENSLSNFSIEQKIPCS
jgi:hypothetical protein